MRLTSAFVLLISCAAPAGPGPASPEGPPERAAVSEPQAPPAVASIAARAAPASESVADLWHWRCCNGRYTGGLAFSQEQGQLRGIFLADEGMGTYVDGTIRGHEVVFTRRWLNAGRLFSQIYTSTLSENGLRLTGSFIETHAPGPAIDFSAERRFQPDLHDFNPLGSKGDDQASRGPDVLLPARCDCSRACGCSGIPKLMECHYACGCPDCPSGIP
jgi:hypothetical protein